MASNFTTAEETYRKNLPRLLAWAGWFALVRDEQLGGVFPTYAAAAEAWMSLYGPVPALIRRIRPVPEAVATAERASSAGRPAEVNRTSTAQGGSGTARRGDLGIGWAPAAKRYAA